MTPGPLSTLPLNSWALSVLAQSSGSQTLSTVTRCAFSVHSFFYSVYFSTALFNFEKHCSTLRSIQSRYGILSDSAINCMDRIRAACMQDTDTDTVAIGYQIWSRNQEPKPDYMTQHSPYSRPNLRTHASLLQGLEATMYRHTTRSRVFRI